MLEHYQGVFFLDSSDLEVVKKWNAIGVIDGVTTNPQIMLDNGVSPASYRQTIRDICAEMGTRSVSVELTADRNSVEKQIEEALDLSQIADNVTIKVPFNPMNPEKGLEVMHRLVREQHMSVNATVMMNFEQLALAAAAMRGGERRSFVSLFWGRAIEDWAARREWGERKRKNERIDNPWAPEGMRIGDSPTVNSDPALITRAMVKRLSGAGYAHVDLIVGSVRDASMVGHALDVGAHIVTVPADILAAMGYSPRAVQTLAQFDKAWEDLQRRK